MPTTTSRRPSSRRALDGAKGERTLRRPTDRPMKRRKPDASRSSVIVVHRPSAAAHRHPRHGQPSRSSASTSRAASRSTLQPEGKADCEAARRRRPTSSATASTASASPSRRSSARATDRRQPARREGPGPGHRARRARPARSASARCCRTLGRRRRPPTRPAPRRPVPRAGAVDPTPSDDRPSAADDDGAPRRRRPVQHHRAATPGGAPRPTTLAPTVAARQTTAPGAGRRPTPTPWSLPGAGRPDHALRSSGPAFALGEDAIATAAGRRAERQWVVDLDLKDGARASARGTPGRRSATARRPTARPVGMAIVLDGTVIVRAGAARPRTSPTPTSRSRRATASGERGQGPGPGAQVRRAAGRAEAPGGADVSATLGKDSLHAGLDRRLRRRPAGRCSS